MKFSISEILKMSEPGELFSGDPNTIKEEYHGLAKIYHPNLHGNSKESNEAMSQINNLYQRAKDMIDSGKWTTPGLIKLSGKDNKNYEIRYRISHDFELGKMYISNTVVLYLINEENRDLFENANKIMSGFKYADKEMKEEYERYLPTVLAKFETKDNQLGVVIKKTPDLVLLRDVLNFYEGRIPDRHVAWILSSLYNLVCYLDFAKLSHNTISLDTYFISPQYHSGCLLGGWWYSVPQGEKMLGVSEEIYSIMPPHVKEGKSGSIMTDLEAIRLLGRELLGDKNGTRLSSLGSIPQPFIDWVRGVSSPNARKDYSKWREIITNSYGERKFVEMKIDDKEFYKKLKEK